MISIRKYSRREFETVKEFYFRAFKGDIGRKTKAFEWIQTQNPFFDHHNNYILIFLNGRLAGYWGVMPVKIYLLGFPFRGLFSQEALIDPSYRGQGLGKRLLNEVNKSNCFLISLWHNEPILSILKNSGWFKVGCFRPLRKIYKFDNIFNLKRNRPGSLRFLSKLLEFYLSTIVSRKEESDIYSVQKIKRFDQEFDELFFGIAAKLGIISDRTCATLNWKYIDIPYKQYYALSVRKKGELTGYAILRVEDQEHDVKKGIIVDLLCKPWEPGAFEFLMGKCDEIFVKKKADFSVCQVSLTVFRKALRKRGYFQSRKRDTDSLWIYNHEKYADSTSLKNLRDWYFTYGDSDGDMW